MKLLLPALVLIAATGLTPSVSAAGPKSQPAPASAQIDPAMLTEAKALLTSLRYYRGPEPGQPEAATLSRALTNWLFHHNLPADQPITPILLGMLKHDLDAGDLVPLDNAPIGANTIEELPRSPDEPPAPPMPQPNIPAYCRKVFSQSNQLYNVCIQQEQAAYNRLRNEWAHIPPKTRDYCSQAFTDEFQLLVVCIEQELRAGASTPSFRY